jgi:hypothetical protein
MVLSVFTLHWVLYLYTTISYRGQASEGDGDYEAHQRCSSLFRHKVRDRILKDAEEQVERDILKKKGFFVLRRRASLRVS